MNNVDLRWECSLFYTFSFKNIYFYMNNVDLDQECSLFYIFNFRNIYFYMNNVDILWECSLITCKGRDCYLPYQHVQTFDDCPIGK